MHRKAGRIKMILVLGGMASGKRTYVQSLGYVCAEMNKLIESDAPVLLGLEELLKQGPLTESGVAALTRKEVVVCCEVGMGVVPVDAAERAWRELVGRTCCTLAAQATQVVRMVCGIPVKLK